MSGSTLVTNGKIRSQPNNDNYRDNYDAIFGTKVESERLLDEATRQYSEDGLVDLTIMCRLTELGIDVSDFT